MQYSILILSLVLLYTTMNGTSAQEWTFADGNLNGWKLTNATVVNKKGPGLELIALKDPQMMIEFSPRIAIVAGDSLVVTMSVARDSIAQIFWGGDISDIDSLTSSVVVDDKAHTIKFIFKKDALVDKIRLDPIQGAGKIRIESIAIQIKSMSYLDNGKVRIGMDLKKGGAVTYLSSSDHPDNIINSADLGRQIQMSHYSFPVPFTPNGKQPSQNWTAIGWNPIQTGDHFKNPSVVEECRNDGKELYIRCIPMHWPLDNEPGECVYETWTTLKGDVIHMRFRMTNKRPDKTQYPARAQELPAVYTISKLDRVMTYDGDKPFTDGNLTHIKNDYLKTWPWTSFIATEGWAAMVDSHDWGLGIFKDDGAEFHGGLHGEAGNVDPMGWPTTYLGPIHLEMIDHNIVYDYHTEFMVGKLADMRRYFNSIATRTPPLWQFKKDRQHWSVEGGVDQGYPLDGAWRIRAKGGTLKLVSSAYHWLAEDAGHVTLDVKWQGASRLFRLYWKTSADRSVNKEKSMTFDLTGDREWHKVTINLGQSPTYRGVIIGLMIEPELALKEGEVLELRSIRFEK